MGDGASVEGRRPSVHRPAERMTLVKLASVGIVVGMAVGIAVECSPPAVEGLV